MSTTRVASHPLAEVFIGGEGIWSEAKRLAAANVLMILCAWIAIPLPGTPVPVTGQTFGLLLVAALFGARRSSLALTLYLLEGAAGLPVFQPYGLPGPPHFFGPTAGYLLAYPAAAFAAGWLMENFGAGKMGQICAMLGGETIIFLGGCVWLAAYFRFGWRVTLFEGLLPFVPGEIVKMVLVLAAVHGLTIVKSRTDTK